MSVYFGYSPHTINIFRFFSILQCPGVRPRHALIEFCPKTDSFWLRQLLPFEEERGSQQMASGWLFKHNIISMDNAKFQEPMPPPPYPYEEEGFDERQGQNSAANDDTESEVASRNSTREQVLQDGQWIVDMNGKGNGNYLRNHD